MADTPSLPPMPPAPKPPGKIKRFFRWVIAWPGRVWRWSVPTKAAWITLLVLLVIVAVAWSEFLADPASLPWRHAMSFGRILAVVILLFVIPFVVYSGLRLWLEGDTSRFPGRRFRLAGRLGSAAA